MSSKMFYLVNSLAFYRLLSAPVLMFLVIYNQSGVFKYLLAVSFLTDAIDGFLARRFNVRTDFGAKLDSIADQLTVAAAIIGMIFFKPGIIANEKILVVLLLILFLIQTAMALVRYHRISSFHTYLAKIAAIAQALFFMVLFFLPQPSFIVFYVAVILTAIDLIEEIILVLILPKWEANVKGLYWVIKKKAGDKYQATL